MSSEITADEVDFVRIDKDLINRAIETLDALKKRGLKAVTAESCTGRLIATVLTEAPGAAEHFEGGFVFYTPEQKYFALKVSPAMIEITASLARRSPWPWPRVRWRDRAPI